MDKCCLVIPLSLLFIPVFDAFRVMVVRYYQRHPLFLADRNHIHHKCLAAGLTHLQSTLLLISYMIIMLFVNLKFAQMMDLNIVLIINILLAILMNYMLNMKIRQRKSAGAKAFDLKIIK